MSDDGRPIGLVLDTTAVAADDDLLLDWTLYYGAREDLAAAAVLSCRHTRCIVLTDEPDAYSIGGRRPRWVVAIDGSW